ncbi:MAG: ABC transporter ATP-binding protein [Verrucomicrobiae bacterium]|nr:ABC transporter ATP-binding protein [Verrucomicrobiae bacterium]
MNNKDDNSGLILRTSGLTKTYPTADGAGLTVLDSIDLEVKHGSTCAIVGPSGSGKTTLLGLCAGLDHASAGTVTIDNETLGDLDEDARAALRNQKVGFVFQNFQLIPTLTAVENVLVPQELCGKSGGRKEAQEWLERVGLGGRLQHYPIQLSGGEQQRVALARAFVNQPRLLFADEPTGNLDEESSAIIEELLFGLNTEAGTALVIVTHDLELAKKAQQVVRMKGGKIVERTSGSNAAQKSYAIS